MFRRTVFATMGLGNQSGPKSVFEILESFSKKELVEYADAIGVNAMGADKIELIRRLLYSRKAKLLVRLV